MNFFSSVICIVLTVALLTIIGWEMLAFTIEHTECQKYNHNIRCHLDADFLGDMWKRILAFLLLLASPALAANTPPPGTNGQLIYNSMGHYGALSGNGPDIAAAAAIHNVIAAGISYDPRDPAYGAICAGYNTFNTDGTTTAFTYTIPFTGTSSTDNSNFTVFYELPDGTGTATILTTSQFSVTGVNSGAGGTITLNSAPPNGDVLIVVHDDAAGLTAASATASASGGYVEVPDGCTIYGSQANGTQLAEGAQLIGQNFTPNYIFDGAGTNPIIRVIAPTGFEPAYGINVSGKKQQFFEGFEITSNVPGYDQLGFLKVPVLIGANTSAGAGGGESPGIVVQYDTFNSGSVGFGAPIGGSSGYIFAVVRFNNFVANNAGIYGPLSDQQIIGNNFSSNGGFGSYGSAGGMVIGPQEGAPGASGAGRIEYNRFEFNSDGIVVQSGGLINMEGNQFDGNAFCGLDLNTFWSHINVSGGWFRGNGNGGPPYDGSTAAGKDAHICFNGGSGSGYLTLSNVDFINNYSEGSTAPIGNPGATTPLYVLDFNGTAANNDNVDIEGGSAPFGQGIANDASVTDFAIFRNGRPSTLKIHTSGQAVQGSIANGNFPSQARGIPSNQWGGYDVFGDAGSVNNQFTPLANGYAAIVANKLGVGPTYFILNNFSNFDCDVVQSEIIPNVSPTLQNNPLMTWLPSTEDPTFGGGSYTNHLIDTHTCHLGALTWMATPRDYKVYAQSSGFVNTGTWTDSSAYAGYYGVTSNTEGDTSVGTITTNGDPIYLWYQMDTTSGGTFTYQLDSGPVSANVAVKGANALGAGTLSMGAIRIPVQSSGSHIVSVALTSATDAGNAVTIFGIGTPPGKSYDGSAPLVVFGGQIQNGFFPAASTAFNNDNYALASQLFADGEQIGFAPVQNYVVPTTDIINYASYPSTQLYASGQLHVADAFNAAIQGVWNAGRAVNPVDYGASCNVQMFNDNFNSAGNHAVTTVANSPVVSVANYTFQPGMATQNGGGDVGKVWSPGHASDNGPTTYILSVNTTNNTATLGENMLISTTGGAALMGGYPSNPNDPSTAQDDTIPIQAASAAAVLGGGYVALPHNCGVHNLTPASHSAIVGNNGDNDYREFNGYPNFANTPVYFMGTGFSDDYDAITGQARSVAFNTDGNATADFTLKDFTVVCDNFPFNPPGMYAAAIGEQRPVATDLDPDHVFVDHVTITGCPVAFNQPLGNNQPVVMTGSISGTTLSVTAITSTNFQYLYEDPGGPVYDFLSVGRPLSGTNIPSGETIVKALSSTSTPGWSGLTGTYQVSLSASTSSETITSTPAASATSGTMQNTEMAQDGIGWNGDCSDCTWSNNIGTTYGICAYIGPPSGGAGTSSNRFNGGRCETGGGLIFDGGGDDQLTGMQFQAVCPIRLVNTGNHLQVTGGWMQGGNCAGNSMVLIGGGWTDVDFSGVSADYRNFGGGNQANYFAMTSTGYTGDKLSIEGGDMQNGFTTAFENFTNGAPVHYTRRVSGLPVIDTSVGLSAASTGFTIGSVSGGANYATFPATSTAASGIITLTLPPVFNNWNCSGGDQTAHSSFALGATTSTSAALYATTTVTSGDVLSVSCPSGR